MLLGCFKMQFLGSIFNIIRHLEGRAQITSVFKQICDNPDFLPGVTDPGLRIWATKGNSNPGDLFGGSTLMFFNQLIEKYHISEQDFFCFLQINGFCSEGHYSQTRVLHVQRGSFSYYRWEIP